MGDTQKILRDLIQAGKEAKAHYQIWWSIASISLPDFQRTMQRYVDFFDATRAAHFHCMIVSLAKVFDRNRKASSLCNYLRKEIHALSPLEADRLDDLLSPHNQVIDAVRRIRHEFAAHTTAARTIEEIFQRAGVAPDQIQDLISAASEAINTLGRRLGWTNLIFTSDRAVRSTMSLLQDLKIAAI